MASAETLQPTPRSGVGQGDDTREPVVSSTVPAPVPNTIATQAIAQTGSGALGGFSARQYGASALTTSQLRTAMAESLGRTARRSAYLGRYLSGYVLEQDGTVSWSYRADTVRMPASSQKMLTAYTVLRSISPDAVLATKLQQDPVDAQRVILRGGGDPTMTPWRLRLLAQAAAKALKAQGRTAVVLVLDTSAIATTGPATGWKSSYLSSDVQLVQGLPLAGYRGSSSAASKVGSIVAQELARLGVSVTRVERGTSPAGAQELARVVSAPIKTLVATMLSESNNDIAEHLLRLASLSAGRTGTWWGALTYERELLAAAGIPVEGLVLADGSGLSRANRMPVPTMAAVIKAMYSDASMKPVVFAWGATPVSGYTGTLSSRYLVAPHVCARGDVSAKTGTLNDAVALAGVARGVDGTTRVFVLLENGLSGVNRYVRLAQDTLATTVVGCRIP